MERVFDTNANTLTVDAHIHRDKMAFFARSMPFHSFFSRSRWNDIVTTIPVCLRTYLCALTVYGTVAYRQRSDDNVIQKVSPFSAMAFRIKHFQLLTLTFLQFKVSFSQPIAMSQMVCILACSTTATIYSLSTYPTAKYSNFSFFRFSFPFFIRSILVFSAKRRTIRLLNCFHKHTRLRHRNIIGWYFEYSVRSISFRSSTGKKVRRQLSTIATTRKQRYGETASERQVEGVAQEAFMCQVDFSFLFCRLRLYRLAEYTVSSFHSSREIQLSFVASTSTIATQRERAAEKKNVFFPTFFCFFFVRSFYLCLNTLCL